MAQVRKDGRASRPRSRGGDSLPRIEGPPLQFGILGPLTVNGSDAHALGLERQQRHLIAALLAQPRKVVSVHELAASLWPLKLPADDRNQIQVQMSRARARLGGASGVLMTVTDSYRLAIELDQLDALRFERLTSSAAGVLATDPARARIYLDDALDLWRGRAFGEFCDAPATRGRAQELEELRIDARKLLVRALLATGAHAKASSAVAALVGEHPLREDIRTLQMRTLARIGNVKEAVASYRDFWLRMGEDGLEPSAAIREVELRIQRGQPVDDPGTDRAGRGFPPPALVAPDNVTIVCAHWSRHPTEPGRPSGTGELALAVEDCGGRVMTLEHGRIVAALDEPAKAIDAVLELAGRKRHGVRVGMHRGPSISMSGQEVGPTSARASELTNAAHSGQVLLTKSAAAWIEEHHPGEVLLHDLGLHRLADLVRPEQLFALRHDRLLTDERGPRSLELVPNNLRDHGDRFVGREGEARVVAELVGSHRLVTLTGAGGCGKTRLATHVAAQLASAYADGAFRVDLADVRDPRLVAATVADALGLARSRMQAMVEVVLGHLRERELLLLFDNCEHLVGACAELAAAIRDTCPRVQIISTSTEPLRATGEQVWPVPPLALPADHEDFGAAPDALRLLVERVAAFGGFRLDADLAALATRLVRLLEGIPLAIEIVAPRVLNLGLLEIVEGLERAAPGGERLRLLEGTGPAHARHETMLLTVAWGYDRLNDDERRLLRCLATLAGSFSLADARAMASCATDLDRRGVDTTLLELAECSMVVTEHLRGGGVRYRLLGPIRDYALAEAERRGERDTLSRRHAGWFQTIAEHAAGDLNGPRERAALERLDEVHDNLRAALEWAIGAGEVDMAHRLVGAAWWYWYMRAHMAEGQGWAQRALALPGGEPGARAKSLNCMAHLAYWRGEFDLTVTTLEALLADPDLEHDASALGWAAMGLAAVGLFRAVDQERRLTLARMSVDWLRDGADAWEHSYALVTLGVLTWFGADYEGAAAPLDEALAIQRRLGPCAGLSSALRWRGLLAGLLGDYELGEAHCEASLELSAQLNDRTGVGYALAFLGTIARYQGDLERARPFYAKALAAGAQIGEFLGVRWALHGLAGCACADGHHEFATRVLSRLDAIARETDTELAPAERSAAASDRETCRVQLGDRAFRRAWLAGQSASPEQVVIAAVAYAAAAELES